jgi:hypothetical protein
MNRLLLAVLLAVVVAAPVRAEDDAQATDPTQAAEPLDRSTAAEAEETGEPATAPAATPDGPAPTGVSRLERAREKPCRDEGRKQGLGGDDLERHVRACERRTRD